MNSQLPVPAVQQPINSAGTSTSEQLVQDTVRWSETMVFNYQVHILMTVSVHEGPRLPEEEAGRNVHSFDNAIVNPTHN